MTELERSVKDAATQCYIDIVNEIVALCKEQQEVIEEQGRLLRSINNQYINLIHRLYKTVARFEEINE